jgi:xanthine dehydrogenase accessory factor
MSKEIYNQLLQLLKNGMKVVVQTEFLGRQGNILREMKRNIITESQCRGFALQSLEQGMPLIEVKEEKTVLVEPFFPEERLIVLGGGHIALPLVEFASKVGFSVTVVDDRLSFANINRFPLARQVLCAPFDQALQRLSITDNDYVVIITRGHRHDQTCLEQLLKGVQPFYTGMIGSRRRVGALKELLIEAGYSHKRLEQVHTPIGLAIGAVTPEEIAISIMAELIACKRQTKEILSGKPRLLNRSDIDFGVIRLLGGEEESKAVVTVISTKGSVPRGAGAKMLVYPDGKVAGSIGGGCSEAAVIGDARQIIGTGGYQIKTIDMTGDVAEDDGMVCGGIMQVMIEDYC